MAKWEPIAGEGLLEFAERLCAADECSFQPLIDHFGVSDLEAKAIFIASVEFDARFSYNGWKRRSDRGLDGGARHFLKRRYHLDDNIADDLVAEFKAGNRRGLVKFLDFSELAHRLVTERAIKELLALGLVHAPAIPIKEAVQ